MVGGGGLVLRESSDGGGCEKDWVRWGNFRLESALLAGFEVIC